MTDAKAKLTREAEDIAIMAGRQSASDLCGDLLSWAERIQAEARTEALKCDECLTCDADYAPSVLCPSCADAHDQRIQAEARREAVRLRTALRSMPCSCRDGLHDDGNWECSKSLAESALLPQPEESKP